jgi:hypothetical protein
VPVRGAGAPATARKTPGNPRCAGGRRGLQRRGRALARGPHRTGPRDYYAGRLGDADLEERLLRNVDERQFRAVCQYALEGLASKKLNLEMLIERRARAREQRVVPETIARFLREGGRVRADDLETCDVLQTEELATHRQPI